MAEVSAAPGSFEARYLAFLETVVRLRPKLHRFCARMTGSVLDGEDVVQDALFDAYRRLETFDDSRPLGPWLFRIAHNRCIDFFRRRDTRRHAEDSAAAPPVTAAVDPPGPALGRAVEHLVRQLPPKERACVLLKDVFEYTIEEIADLVESTPGGVKAALHRGREKLVAAPRPAATPAAAEIPDDERRLLRLYVERFNRQDWQGLRDLIAADATLRVADRFHGRFGSLYVDRYARLTPPLRAVLSDVDGEPVIALYLEGEPLAPPRTFVRLSCAEGRITAVADYTHCPWVMASVERVSPIPPDA